MKKQLRRILWTITVLPMFLISFVAGAASISGDINFTGGGDILDLDGLTVTDFNDAVTLDFDPNTIIVTSSTGDFLDDGLTFGDTGTILDIDLSLSSITGLWTIDGDTTTFTFDLTSFTTTVNTDGDVLTLDGAGILSALGYDETSASFLLTANSSTGVIDFSFSSNTAAVPVPAAIWLFGSAMFGMVAVSRRKFTS